MGLKWLDNKKVKDSKKEPFQLREVVNLTTVTGLAEAIESVYPSFRAKQFIQACTPAVSQGLGLIERSDEIARVLERQLKLPYAHVVLILTRCLGPPLPQAELQGMDPFYYMPHCSYIVLFGQAPKDYRVSFAFMLDITRRFSAEWPIRPFLLKNPKQVLHDLAKHVTDPDQHVRRLISEGTRPRLPLSVRLPAFQQDPTPVLALLEALKDDPALYVRRSVANNLNDISKDNPQIVVATLVRWQKDADDNRRWLIKHALRTLLKQGHPEALRLQGFNPKHGVSNPVLNLQNHKIPWAQTLVFDLSFTSRNSGKVMVDYLIYFQKANTEKSGKLAPKVFKGFVRKLKKGQTVTWQKKHSLIPRSTRKMYPGAHAVEIQVNGRPIIKKDFWLLEV